MTEKLNAYHQKRDFEKTSEPEGTPINSGEQLRFVIQHHMARSEHYDFRLEWDGTLLSWAVPKGPSFDTREKRLAVHVEDHPLDYRNFEGTIPKGEYGGGTVMLWDEGTWEPLADVEAGLKAGSLKMVLSGRRLKGKWALVRMKANNTADNWLLLKEKDAFVKTEDGISEYTTSIRTGRTMMEIEQEEDEKVIRNPFDKADVQLAKLVKNIPEGEDWLYELKYDGYRILSFVEGNRVRLLTRNNNDYTDRFPVIADTLLDFAAGRACVLDGEMVVTEETGKTDFGALQNAMKNTNPQNLTYILFDILALDGVDLREQPLTQRKETLMALMKDAPPRLHFSQHVVGNGEESLQSVCELGMEGLIGKKADSIYSGTRNGDWIKIKCDKRQEFVIGGFSLTDKKTSGISSLLLGVYDGGNLIYAGRAGTGIGVSEMMEMAKKFEPFITAESPYQIAPKAKSNEKITWLKPEFVAEVKFAEWTKDNLLRQASFKGLRTDKSAKEVKREEPAVEHEVLPSGEVEKPMKTNGDDLTVAGIKITNPDKMMFEDAQIKKEDVIRYYEQVSKQMLPYVSKRILSIVRCPKGVSDACFFKKHPGNDSKEIVTIPIQTSDGETEEYFYIENVSGLIAQAQMGTLEIHIWGSCVDALELPDMLVFDLDPDEGMDLETVRRGVIDLKAILTELSLNSYLKTSGGKGYHVVVPLKPAASWDAVHEFAKRVAEVMEKKWPDRYTSNVRKTKRTGKIFIDWMRNGRGATSIAPYSIRARAGAKVSMPIAWEELQKVAPDGVDMQNALMRIQGDDPWRGFFENEQLLRV